MGSNLAKAQDVVAASSFTYGTQGAAELVGLIEKALDELEARKDAEVKALVEAANEISHGVGCRSNLLPDRKRCDCPVGDLYEALRPFQKNPSSGSEKEKPNANG